MKLEPVDPSKKTTKFHLADVIEVAHEKSTTGWRGMTQTQVEHISSKVKSHPDRERLYARFLYDKFDAKAKAVDDEGIVQSAYDEVRGKIEKAVEAKRAELTVEETKLATLDELTSGGGKKRPAGKAKGGSSTAKENAENDSEKKPAAKKRKVAKKKGLAPSDEKVAPAKRSGGRSRKAVSYAESDSEYEDEQ